jgi:phage terminase large subunit-like protein
VQRELSLIERLARLPKSDLDACLEAVPVRDRYRVLTDWRCQARPSQLAPEGDWSVWLILAGRGFGKTRTGAEWVTARALQNPGARIALVGATMADVGTVMVEGESGLLSCAPPGFRPERLVGRRQLRWPNGSMATLLSAVDANRLRGPQFHFAWCDELAAWSHPREVWDNLRLGLRLGRRPQVVVTTTPRTSEFLKGLMAESTTVLSRGSTFDNRLNLPHAYLADMAAIYGGTSIGRQEVNGELLDRVDGALWSRDSLDKCRKPLENIELSRIVVGVDPPAGAGTCGIVVVGRDHEGMAWVLADASVADTGPADWAAAVASARLRTGADLVVVETNNGGTMVEQVLLHEDSSLPVKAVKASVGKVTRAEPVAALYARGRVHHVQPFRELEDQLCGFVQGGGYVGPGSSPDRADALVWALTELLLPQAAQPQLRVV